MPLLVSLSCVDSTGTRYLLSILVRSYRCLTGAAYLMMIESAGRINTRARLYVKLPLRADAKIMKAAEVIKVAFH